MNDDIRKSIDECVLCWLATADADGVPNVSPKEMFVAHGDKLLIAHIASPESIKNIEARPEVCVSFVDVFKQKGYKLKGTARTVQKRETEYVPLSEKLYSLGGKDFDIKSVIEISISGTSKIIAPSYWLFPNTSEEMIMEQAMNTYGVSRA